ncbi:MAG: Flp pilus assembly protein CpaB [Bryobacteraceae bacterium]
MDRQKMLMIFAGAWVSAALLTWLVYAKAAGPRTEKLSDVIAAARDMPAGTRLKKTDLKKIKIAEKDMPRMAITDEGGALDQTLLHPINANETFARNKFASMGGAEGLSATIENGKRALSVPVTDATGAGGLIQPRSHVDVLFTRTGSMREALTTTILQDIIVLSIGRLTEAGQAVDARVTRPLTQAATLLVTPEEAKKLELAKNQGKISLALRNPLDKSVGESSEAATAETIDPEMFAGSAKYARRMNMPNIRDNGVWNQLTNGAPAVKAKEEKKEPPKPRVVVDVYRGDKHVQEIFQ